MSQCLQKPTKLYGRRPTVNRAYLVTLEKGRILVRAFEPPFALMGREAVWSADFSVTEPDAVVALLKSELWDGAAQVVEEEGK